MSPARTQYSHFLLKTAVILALLAGFIFYGLYKAQDFLAGPEIIIEKPRNGQIFRNSYINVSGQAKNISSISLNGRRIFIDENGNFSENLLLARGYSIIQIEAKDKFGRSVKEKREIVLK